jgi:hypothetical protein
MRNAAIGIGAAVFCAVGLLLARGEAATPPEHLMVSPTEITWAEGPPSLPKGARMAVLEGDLAAAGPFTARLKVPAGYRIPPHWHPAIEHVTVLEGDFYMGAGDTFDEKKLHRLPPGSLAVMQIGVRHFASTQAPAVIQIHGIAPWGITYVNPADDPRTAKP